MVEYEPVNLTRWKVLSDVEENILINVELVHVFGFQGESAYLVTRDDEVYAIGENVCGRLGIEELTANSPIRIHALCGKAVICFATGNTHSLALTKDGDVYAWGSNTNGQVGTDDPDFESQFAPVKISFPQPEEIKQISTADRYCLALTANHRLYHWGDVTWDCAQDSKKTSPVLLKLPHNIIPVQISCGSFHAALLTNSGKVYTWGVNEAGQLGYGDTELVEETPMIVGGQIEDQFIAKITCSALATIVLTSQGELYAWGCNRSGSLCVGDTQPMILTPQRVLFRKDIVDIASSNLHSFICAETSEGQFYFWALDDDDKEEKIKEPPKNMLEAFAGKSMPTVLRNFHHSPERKLSSIQGPVRDIGKALFNIKELSDLTIILGDGEVYVHTLIMKTFSEHFKTLLDENWAKGGNIIDMRQYNARAYRAFLKYVYTGALDYLEGTEIIALCDIAVSYFETELKKLCIKMFDHCLTPKNVVQLYALAVKKHSELVDSCIFFTSQHLESVILSEGFESHEAGLCKNLILNAVKLKHMTYTS